MEERMILLEALRLIDMLFSVIRVMNRFLVTVMRDRWDVDWNAYHNLYQAAALRADALSQSVVSYYGAEIDD